MKVEVGRFSDKRLKAIRKHNKNDSNVRVSENEITIVSKIDEVELERDVIEAINLWNLLYRFPELRNEVDKILKHFFRSKYSQSRT